MHSHCINKLLNIEDVFVKKIVHADTFVKIMLETKPKEHLIIYSPLKKLQMLTKRLNYIQETLKKSF